jgi:hypothetical protein
MAKGAYSLHCFHPEAEQLVKAPQPKKRKMTDFAGGCWLFFSPVAGTFLMQNMFFSAGVRSMGGALPQHRLS